MASALVTGGAGFLGRHICSALAHRGHKVTSLDDLSCPNANFDAPELQNPAITTIRESVLKRDLLVSLVEQHSIVVHCACLVGVEETIADPVQTVRYLDGTMALCEALTPDHTLLFASSADIYGAHSLHYSREMREDDLHVYEDSAINRWVYPMVKALEENLLGAASARVAIVRIFNCFGPGMDYPLAKRVAPRFIRCVLEGRPLRISGDGSQRRTLCYYEDTVRGLLLALEHARAQEAPFRFTVNIGGVESFSVNELAQALIDLGLEMGILREPLPIETHAQIYSQAFYDGWDRQPSIARARELLGYAPRVSVIEGLRRTLEFHRAHGMHSVRPSTARPSRVRVADSDVLIVGAGVAGLACRAELRGRRETTLLEKDDRPGGLLKVYRRGDFVFDTVVHALTLRNPRQRELILQALPRGVQAFDRQSLVWQRGSTINYAYQHHAGQLPPEARDACLSGYADRPAADIS